LRQPRQFLTQLTDETLAEMRKAQPDPTRLDSLSKAMAALLNAQPTLADQVFLKKIYEESTKG
jgi:hypothetical protein